ncbi:hypothetical protein [Acinetobacter calcoaceticus]
MSNKVTTPYPLFSDIDGSPLNAGFLFLGVNGQDAEQNPINVYWNEEKTELAAQPLRTRNGLIVRDDVPVKIFIEEESCSITIKNRSNTLIQKVESYDQLSSVKGVKALIEEEKIRAIAAEDLLGDKLDLAESSLNDSIQAETDRAQAAEQNLQVQITTGNAGIRYFSTEAELLAYVPGTSDPKQAYAFDTKKNYIWQLKSGSTTEYEWKDEGLSQLDQAKNYTDQEVDALDQKQSMLIESLSYFISSKLFNSFQENLFNFTDADGNIVFQIAKNGDLTTVGLPNSIQQHIKKQENIVNHTSDNNLLECIDDDGNLFMKIDKEGKAYFVGFEDDLVTELNSRTEYAEDKDLFKLLDKDESYYLRIDKDSKIYIVGIEGDLATAINSKTAGSAIKDTSSLNEYSYRDTFIPKAERLLSFFRNTQDTGLLAPVPLQSFEQNFSIGVDWIDDAKITEWGNYIPVETPYGQDRGVVHPQILEIPNKFMGYRYILTITGYTNGVTTEENPFLLASNDLQSFDLITPLLNIPDSFTWEKGVVYNSDPFTFYDHKTGELVLTFRRYYSAPTPAEAIVILYAITTKDGKTWSEPYEFYSTNFGDLQIVAQAIFFDAKTETYHMYGVNQSKIRHFTSKNWRSGWVQQPDVVTPVSDTPWHADIKLVGDKLLMTYQNRVGNSSVGFKLGISSDFQTFTWAGDWWNPPTYEVYKATFLPQFNENNEMRLVYIWTSNQQPPIDLRYKLFVQATPYLNVNFVEK